MLDTTAKGRYDGTRGERKDAPQGGARDHQAGGREVQVRPGEGRQAPRPPRDVLEHPAVKKDIRKLDPKVRQKAVDIMHGLASGKEYPTTHALNGHLKGWYATNVTAQHRIIHQLDGDDLLVGHVGPHNYDVAEQRPAGANGPTPELTLHHRLFDPYGAGEDTHHEIEARHNGKEVGGMWVHRHGEIDTVSVDDKYQRRGIANAMWEHAKSLGIDIHHSDNQTNDAIKWAANPHKTAADEHVPDLRGEPDHDHLETVLGKPETHNRPGSREEVIRNAEGTQKLFHVHQFAQGEHERTHTLCQSHAYARAANHAGMAGLNKATGDGRLEGSMVEKAGRGSCPDCTVAQRRALPPSVHQDEHTNRPQRSLRDPNPRPQIGRTAPFQGLPHSLNAVTAVHDTGREKDWQSGNSYADSSLEKIKEHNSNKWAPNIREHGQYRLVHEHPTYHGGKVTAHVQDKRGWKGVGYLTFHETYEGGKANGHEINKVGVHPDHQRKGLASAMLSLARESHPDIRHSVSLSDDGRAWAEKVAFTPHKRIFTHTDGLDHRLWTESEKLRPEIREHVLGEWYKFCGDNYLHNPDSWARVYFAGSEASEWTSSTLEGNNDFDTLVGINYHIARDEVDRFESKSDEDITAFFNEQFKLYLNNQAEFIEVDGVRTGPWDHTWYVNPSSYDIRVIKPYAAYELVGNKWWVKPAHLPHWSLKDFPASVVKELRAVDAYVSAVLNLPEPLRTQQGASLFTHLHSDRSRAFSDRGEGWYDPANLIEKWLDQKGTWAELVSAKHRWDAGEGAAPAEWDNSHPYGQTVALRGLKVQAAAAIRKLSMPMTDWRDKDEHGNILPDPDVEREKHKSPEHAWEAQVDHEQHYGEDARKAFAPHNIHVNDDDDAHPVWHLPDTKVGHGSKYTVQEIPKEMHLHTDQDVIHMPTVNHYRDHGHLDRAQTQGTHPILGKDSHPDNHPQVVKFEGKHWLLDGHHRTLGSRMRGDSHLKVWYRDADAEGVTRSGQPGRLL